MPSLKRYPYLLLLWLLLVANLAMTEKKMSVLVFSKTAGYHHSSIAHGNTAIQKLGKQNRFSVDTSTNADIFNPASLKRYDAIVFLNTTGDILNPVQQSAFEQYIRAGGGFVGIHASADCEYDWPWYGKLNGAYFASHPKVQEAVLQVREKGHSSTWFLPQQWRRRDEWYNFKEITDDLTILISIDESTYKGGTHGNLHPVAWYHTYDGGKAFYTALGHTDASFSEPLFLKHLLGGIRYAAN